MCNRVGDPQYEKVTLFPDLNPLHSIATHWSLKPGGKVANGLDQGTDFRSLAYHFIFVQQTKFYKRIV